MWRERVVCGQGTKHLVQVEKCGRERWERTQWSGDQAVEAPVPGIGTVTKANLSVSQESPGRSCL